MMKSVSIVIPTYNGRHLLEVNLPPLLSAARGHSHPVEIIIVDDAGNDDSITFLQERYPGITVLVNDVNSGFAVTVNRGIRAAKHDIVLALNNDVTVSDDIFSALSWFADGDVFSVTPDMVDPADSRSQSLNRLKPGVCWFMTRILQVEDVAQTPGEIPLFFGSGGASFYDREKLMQLEGFDTIFHPFYVEDLDLSYRAWKAGWKCLFEPKVRVIHKTSSTIRSLHTRRTVKFIGDRNRTMFLWMNITDPFLVCRYFLFLPFSLGYDLIALRKYKFVGFFRALAHVSQVMARRRHRKKLFKLRDCDVIARIA